MSLVDAAYALDELAGGRMPDQARAVNGLRALDPLLLQGSDPELHDAAAMLEAFLATSMIALTVWGRSRAAQLAEAGRRSVAR